MKKVIAALLSMSLCLSGTGMMCSAEEVTVNEVVSERQIKILINQIDELEDQIGDLDDQIDDLEELELFDSTDVNDLIKQIETKKITTVEAKNRLDKKLKTLKKISLKQKISKRKKIICKILKLVLNFIKCGVAIGVVSSLYHTISEFGFKQVFSDFWYNIGYFFEKEGPTFKMVGEKIIGLIFEIIEEKLSDGKICEPGGKNCKYIYLKK